MAIKLDVSKYIDMKTIQNIFDSNAGKRFYCFGGGTAAEIFMELVNDKYTVEAFLDNNTALYGKSIAGKKICSPAILLEEDKEQIVVLILSQHVKTISRQLEKMGLTVEKNYYDIYTPFLPYFRIKKFEGLIQHFMNFLDCIPEGYMESIPVKNEKPIGLVCICEMLKNLTCYTFAQGLLLRYSGYRVTFIIDTLKAFDGYCFFSGVEEVVRLYVEEVLEKIKQKCPDIDILYIEGEGKAKLNANDFAAIKENAELVVKWFQGRPEEGFLTDESEQKRIEITESILIDTLEYIKAFFEKHVFQDINVYTGIHRHRYMYVHTAKEKGMRVSTFDTGAPGKLLYCTDGVAGHSEDIAKLIQGDYFSKNEKDVLLRLAKENFMERKKCTVDDPGYNYQVANYDESIQPYDIIIPLNISWDAAALGRDEIFKSDIEWLERTLRYIICNTDANVLIREHPAQNVFLNYAFIDLREKIPFIREHSERIYFVSASDRINTYQYIESCKLVLPYTSTIGLESVMMGKNIIIHTKVYYGDLGVGYKAKNSLDYFEHIKYYLEHTDEKAYTNQENAFLAYYFQMNNVITCDYSTHGTDWMDLTLEELRQLEGVDGIIKAVAEGIPTIFTKLAKQLFSE